MSMNENNRAIRQMFQAAKGVFYEGNLNNTTTEEYPQSLRKLSACS